MSLLSLLPLPGLLFLDAKRSRVAEASEPPHFALCDCDLQAVGPGPFVVAAVDPDAAPALAEVRHFLGGGFYLEPGQQGEHALVNKTPALSEFLTPAPPAGSGLHRYVAAHPVCQIVGRLTEVIRQIHVLAVQGAAEFQVPDVDQFVFVAISIQHQCICRGYWTW